MAKGSVGRGSRVFFPEVKSEEEDSLEASMDRRGVDEGESSSGDSQ